MSISWLISIKSTCCVLYIFFLYHDALYHDWHGYKIYVHVHIYISWLMCIKRDCYSCCYIMIDVCFQANVYCGVFLVISWLIFGRSIVASDKTTERGAWVHGMCWSTPAMAQLHLNTPMSERRIGGRGWGRSWLRNKRIHEQTNTLTHWLTNERTN